MGDMPIGKLLDHIEFELITLDNFAQFAADCDEKMVAKGFDVDPVPPIEDPDKDAIAALTEAGAGTPTDMLLELLAWRNGGFSVFEYEIHNAPQILADAANQDPPIVIGRDLDGGLLLVRLEDGMLLSEVAGEGMQELGEDLSAWLGRFRHELVSNKLEWADAWVSC